MDSVVLSDGVVTHDIGSSTLKAGSLVSLSCVRHCTERNTLPTVPGMTKGLILANSTYFHILFLQFVSQSHYCRSGSGLDHMHSFKVVRFSNSGARSIAIKLQLWFYGSRMMTICGSIPVGSMVIQSTMMTTNSKTRKSRNLTRCKD